MTPAGAAHAGAAPGAGLPRHHISPRRLLARHLAGSGLELGPGHHPFALPLPGVTVRYVDRWTPDEARQLFPAMGPYAGQPHVIADFNAERLDPVADGSQDFVIASHVLEHLAEPLGFMAEMHRVLHRGGVALVFLPDRHRTRDRNRQPTSLDHLVGEYHAGVREVSDEHLLEFLGARNQSVPLGAEERRAVLDWHRRRSIHVHCWDADEFVEVIRWGIENLAEQWEFLDGCLPFDGIPPADIEFGFVLRRSEVDLDGPTRSRRFEASWTAWCDVQRALLPAVGAADLLGRAYQRARHGLYRQVLRRVRNPLDI